MGLGIAITGDFEMARNFTGSDQKLNRFHTDTTDLNLNHLSCTSRTNTFQKISLNTLFWVFVIKFLYETEDYRRDYCRRSNSVSTKGNVFVDAFDIDRCSFPKNFSLQQFSEDFGKTRKCPK